MDPYLGLTDPDPALDMALFVSDLSRCQQKRILFSSFFAYNFWKVHLHNSSKIKKL